MIIYHAFVSIVDRIDEGDLVDIVVGQHKGLWGHVKKVQDELLYVTIYNDGNVGHIIIFIWTTLTICLGDRSWGTPNHLT